MGVGTFVSAGLGLALAQGQIGLSIQGERVWLSEPKSVTVGVKDVVWESQGRALMYDAVDADGYFQGLYRTSDGKGKAVLRHPSGTTFIDWKWLPKKLAVIELLCREDAAKGTKRWSVYLLDAQSLAARELLGLTYPKDEEVSMTMQMSPTRDHALIDVRDAKGERTYVILDNGSSLTLSSDVTLAKAQGAQFAGWSADGTAYFHAPGFSSNMSIENPAQKDQTIQGVMVLESRTRNTPLLTSVPILSKLVWRSAPIAPALGTPVLEVMSWNGGMRPVRSRGPHEEEEIFALPFEPKPEAAVVTASMLRGDAKSLWLVPETPDASGPRPAGGLLVAAEAGQSWLSSRRNWIAYETAGALFVRQVMVGR